jgi:predicted MFS family arabinose efflux permease
LVHQVPLFTDVGLSREDAAWLASISGVGGIAGKLITGYLMDRSNPNFVGGATMGVAALGFLFLMEPFRSMPVIVGCAFIIGYSSGAKLQITAFLTGRYAGMKHFGTIFGVMSSLITVGSAFGPFMAGAIFDHYGNYDMLLNIGVVGALCAGCALFILGKQPNWSPLDDNQAKG